MTAGVNIAEVAALAGDPARANILAALLDGRAQTAGELAHAAGVTAATASGHLAKLTDGRLLVAQAQGRHRYFRLASVDVAQMLEAIMVVADTPTLHVQPGRATPRVPVALREARACYDHMAGRLGVALADALVRTGVVILSPEGGEVTEAGRALFERLGVSLAPAPTSRRLLCRPCMDWSERRPHIAGVLGAALLDRALTLGWVRRAPSGRALSITPEGRRGFAEVFGAEL
jgi:DNA-binding transcriptional ArsR family regulator